MAQGKLIDGKYEYFAFISYKEEDAEWAKWLQRKLEHYKLPTAIRKENPKLPERISPIYEYKSEAGGGRLKDVIWKGLTSSKYLIVICSPRAGGNKSQWLNNGIKYFVTSGLEENIIPFIVEGKPKADNPDEECFPKALLELKGDRELRGININEMGRDAAAVKIVSYMFDVKFDALWQRYARELEEEKQKLIDTNNRILRNLARFVAEKAQQVSEEDSYLGCLLALEVLSTSKNMNYPYTSEAEAALRTAIKHRNGILRADCVVYDVAFSLDGKRIATCGDDCKIHIWDVQNGMLLFKLSGHLDIVSSVSYSPSGKLIASSSWDKTIRIWDSDSYQLLQVLRGHNGVVESLTFSPDGAYLVSGSRTDSLICIWKTGNWELKKTLHGDKKQIKPYFDFCIDGKSIAYVVDDATIHIYDIEKETIAVLQKSNTSKEREYIECISYSPDGAFIVSAFDEFDKHTIVIWNIKNGKVEKTIEGHKAMISFVSYSPDGKWIISCSYDNTLRIWNAQSYELVKIIKSTWTISKVSFSPDMNRMATTGFVKSIQIYGKMTEPLTLRGHNRTVMDISISPDGLRLASASYDKTVRIWDLTKGSILKILYGHTELVESVSFSPDGKLIASSSYDETIIIWDSYTGNIVNILKGHTGKVCSVCFNHKGDRIVSASLDDTARIWDVQTGTLLSILYPHGQYGAIGASYSPSDELILSTAIDGFVRIWDSRTGVLIKIIKDTTGNGVVNAYFSPDGNHILTTSNNAICIWDIATGKSKTIVENTGLCIAAYSSDGKLYLHSHDNNIYIRDVKTNFVYEILEGHSNHITSAMFSPNGQHIVSASPDCTIKVWSYFPLQTLVEQTQSRFKDRQLTPEDRHKYYLE